MGLPLNSDSSPCLGEDATDQTKFCRAKDGVLDQYKIFAISFMAPHKFHNGQVSAALFPETTSLTKSTTLQVS